MKAVSFDFTLAQAVSFDHEGKKVSSTLLSLRAPSAKNIKLAIRLQAAYSASIKALNTDFSEGDKEEARAEKEKKEKEGTAQKEMTGSEIMDLIKITNAIDMEDFYDAFRKLLCSSHPKVCVIDDKQVMTETIYDEILFVDLEKLLGEYLARFLV